MCRNAPIENQNSANVEASIKMHEGYSTNKTKHAIRRLAERMSLLSLKKWYGCLNRILKEGKKKFKEIGRWFSRKTLQNVDENDIVS